MTHKDDLCDIYDELEHWASIMDQEEFLNWLYRLDIKSSYATLNESTER